MEDKAIKKAKEKHNSSCSKFAVSQVVGHSKCRRWCSHQMSQELDFKYMAQTSPDLAPTKYLWKHLKIAVQIISIQSECCYILERSLSLVSRFASTDVLPVTYSCKSCKMWWRNANLYHSSDFHLWNILKHKSLKFTSKHFFLLVHQLKSQ